MLALQLGSADYTVQIVRFKLAAPFEDPSRPKGVGLTALALGALILINFIRGLFHLFGGNLAALPLFEQLFIRGGECLELLLIWNYWKGQDWGRIFVLLWSFVVAARELSILIDRDGSLVSLMSQPVRFFHALLAMFLLYFLNTRRVRAWFKKVSATAASLIHQQLVGKLCTAVEKSGDGSVDVWRLAFEHDAELILHCPWRIAMDDNLAFASNTAPEIPFDEEQPLHLLQNLRVKAVRVKPRTSDLFVTFEMGIELQTWSTDPRTSPHVQQWKFSDPALAVTADSVGLNSQTLATPVPNEDSAAND